MLTDLLMKARAYPAATNMNWTDKHTTLLNDLCYPHYKYVIKFTVGPVYIMKKVVKAIDKIISNK